MAIDKITLQATDNLFVNTEITGTEAAKMPVGTTGERANEQAGDIRFNSSSALMEYYDGTQWKSIDAPPLVSSISPTTESDPNANITITGANFATSVTVKFVGNDGTEYSSPSVTRNSTTEVVATTPATALSVANEPYDVVVTNTSSSLSGTLADALDAGGVPAFNESAGSLGTVYDSGRTGLSFDAGATDPDGDTITYSVSVGALPSGLSLNTSTGAITGDATAVGSDTTSTFTISAATSSDTSTREFSITIAAPVVTTYTSVASGTFSVPSGISSVDVLLVAGGGSGGSAGGGGAGGLIYRPQFPVTPGGSVSYTVGDGGAGLGTKQTPGPSQSNNSGNPGQNSIFGTLTALAGGGGGAYNGSQSPSGTAGGRPGGSGGGGGAYHPQNGGGAGNQPSQPGDSGTYGFGNPGGFGTDPSSTFGSGGGGGAGAAGGPTNNSTWAPVTRGGGDGGIGKAYDISGTSYYYAGGGGGGCQAPGGGTAGAGYGGQGGGGGGTVWDSSGGAYPGAGAPMYNGNVGEQGTNNNQTQGVPQAGSGPGGDNWADGGDAADNSGGGGGGAGISVTYGGAGGSGIVIVKY